MKPSVKAKPQGLYVLRDPDPFKESRIALERMDRYSELEGQVWEAEERGMKPATKRPRKQSSSKLSKLAARAMRFPQSLTVEEIKSLAASVLSQDETK